MMTTPQAPRMVNTSCEKESGERVSSGHAGRNPSRDTARSPKYRGGRGGAWTGFTHVLLLPVPGVRRVQPGVSHLGRGVGVGCGRTTEGKVSVERGGRVDKSNPGCSWRGSGNSRTFGRLTCHAAGLLGDGALGHRVEAAGQRGRGAENTGHGLAAEDRSRECDPRGAKYPGSRGVKPDSRVQGSIARHPSASRAAKSSQETG